MHESTKTRAVRSEEFYGRYLAGSVLDIGCGPDPCVPHAVPFDVQQGDANLILNYVRAESFDCVYSSHCLEHMINARRCLQEWWAIVKRGGYLVTVVPEEDLYEQGIWPSLFNPDHKHTFRLDRASTWSPVSIDLGELVRALPKAEVVHAAVHGRLEHVKVFRGTPTRLRKWINGFRWALYRKGCIGGPVDALISGLANLLHCPVDRTLGPDLAQIEVVARKKAG